MKRRMSPGVRPACRAVLILLLTVGCSVQYKVAGSFDNANEVFRGDVVHDLLSGSADVVAVGQNSGIVCRGRSYATHVPALALGCTGQRGKVDMTCDDGRTLDVDWRADSCTSGSGRGRDRLGNRFSFAFGLNAAEAEAHIARRLPDVRQRPALRGFAPTGRDLPPAAPARPPAFDRKAAADGLADFPVIPVSVAFPGRPARPDDVAVVIANANYAAAGTGLPDVVPAYADAEGFKRYVTQAAGVPEGNVVLVRDATSAELAYIFGTRRNPRGKLHEWVKPGRSRVHVYFAGHGAPGDRAGRSFLMPVDVDGSMIAVKGYPLDVLYANLAQLPAAAVTVVIEAGFSGVSEGGSVLNELLPELRPATTPVPAPLTVLTAGAPSQVASWETDGRHSLFTKYLLTALGGAADRTPHGDGNGKIDWPEVDAFLKATVSKLVRDRYGRRQVPSITPARAPDRAG